MELKDFIKETLSQIIDAVSETQEKYKDKHVLICPDDIQSEKGEYYIDNESHYEYYILLFQRSEETRLNSSHSTQSRMPSSA